MNPKKIIPINKGNYSMDTEERDIEYEKNYHIQRENETLCSSCDVKTVTQTTKSYTK